MRHSWIKTLCCITMLILTTGCWDRIEIDERGFVLAVAIDAPSEEEAEKEEKTEEPTKKKGKQTFKLTYQVVKPAGFSGGRGSQGGTGEKPYFNITAVEDTMFSVNAKMSTMLSREPFFEHLKLIIVSEEVAKSKYGFANVLDYYLRDSEMRRNVKVMVTKGEARKILDVLPLNEKLPSMYINSVAENTKRSARMAPESRIGDIHEFLLKKESFVIQRIQSEKKAAVVEGAAVFAGVKNVMMGFLNPEETEGMNFLRQDIDGGMLEIPIRDNLGAFKFDVATRDFKLNYGDEEGVKVTVLIKTEGALAETFERPDLLKEKNFEYINTQVEKEIERISMDCINKLQKEFKKDVIGIGAFIKEDHYDLWKRIEDNWEEGGNLFSKAKIEIKVNAEVRRVGTINKSEERK